MEEGDVKEILHKYLKIKVETHKLSESGLLKLAHDFFNEIAIH